MNEPSMDLQTRLERLEKDHRRLARAHKGALAALAVMALLATVGWRAKADVFDTVRTERLEIVDSSGKVSCLVTQDTTGRPGVWMYNSDGKKRIQLGFAGDSDAGLWTFDNSERQMVNIHSEAGGNPEIMCVDTEGYPLVSMKKDSSGDSGVYVYDGGHRPRAMMELRKADIGMFRLADKDGNIKGAFAADSTGASFRMMTGDAENRIFMSSVATTPYLVFYGKDGKELAKYPPGADTTHPCPQF